MTNVRAPIPFCSKLDQLNWPYFSLKYKQTFHLISLRLAVPTVHHTSPHQLFASTHPCAGGHSARLAQFCSGRGLSLTHPKFLCRILSPPHTPVTGVLLSRLPKIMLPTKCCHPCVVWGSVSSCLPVTAQARIALAFRHLFFNCIPCSYLICYPLRHFLWDCLLSSSFLPNIFVLDYIYLLMENFNFPRDSI